MHAPGHACYPGTARSRCDVTWGKCQGEWRKRSLIVEEGVTAGPVEVQQSLKEQKRNVWNHTIGAKTLTEQLHEGTNIKFLNRLKGNYHAKSYQDKKCVNPIWGQIDAPYYYFLVKPNQSLYRDVTHHSLSPKVLNLKRYLWFQARFSKRAFWYPRSVRFCWISHHFLNCKVSFTQTYVGDTWVLIASAPSFEECRISRSHLPFVCKQDAVPGR